MHVETERKFLVRGLDFKEASTSRLSMVQGYIAHDGGRTVRVRLVSGKGFLTIKGPSADGISRLEWEWEIPQGDARDLLRLRQGSAIEKTRWIVPACAPDGSPSARFFEVDEFHGDNEGLIVAEIELGDKDEPFLRPSWLGDEVTGDRRYYNSSLVSAPFRSWAEGRQSCAVSR